MVKYRVKFVNHSKIKWTPLDWIASTLPRFCERIGLCPVEITYVGKRIGKEIGGRK